MCALCGVIGGNDHWTDPVARDGVYVRGTSPSERRRERARRISEANQILRLFALTLEDWQGSAYMLRTLTGKTEVIDNLAALWPMAERIAGRPIDPLDSASLERREQAGD